MQKLKINDQLVPKIVWKQMDGQTDKGDCITSLGNDIHDHIRDEWLITKQNLLSH